MVSADALMVKAGAIISFDWYASGAADFYDVFGYLLNVSSSTLHQMNGHFILLVIIDWTCLISPGFQVDTGASITILNEYGGGTDWATFTFTVPTTGMYKFVFIRYEPSGLTHRVTAERHIERRRVKPTPLKKKGSVQKKINSNQNQVR